MPNRLHGNMNQWRTRPSWQKMMIHFEIYILRVALSVKACRPPTSLQVSWVCSCQREGRWTCGCVQRSDISLCAEYSPLCTKVHDISQTACPLNASVCSVCRSLCDLYIKKKNHLFRGHINSVRWPQVSFWGIVTLTLPPWTKLSIGGAVCVCGRLGKNKLSPFPSNLKMDDENVRIPGREKYLFTWCRQSYDSENVF